jgi:hypothetical protein
LRGDEIGKQVRSGQMGSNRISLCLPGGRFRQGQVGIAMTRFGHVGWRAAAVMVAFAGTATLAVTLTRAPGRSLAAASSANTSCPTSVLRASLGRAGTAGTAGPVTGTPSAGGTYFALEFTNVSHQVCSLFGYPEVSAYVIRSTSASQAGGPGSADSLGGVAIHDPLVQPRSVRLEPGETAQSWLRIAGTGSSKPRACRPDIAGELRVTLPHQGLSAFVPVHIPVCSAEGHVSLSVQALQARSGISGYTVP